MAGPEEGSWRQRGEMGGDMGSGRWSVGKSVGMVWRDQRT